MEKHNGSIPIYNQENWTYFSDYKDPNSNGILIIKTDGKSLIEKEMGSFIVL